MASDKTDIDRSVIALDDDGDDLLIVDSLASQTQVVKLGEINDQFGGILLITDGMPR